MFSAGEETRRLKKLCERAEGGFLKLIPKEFRTRGIAEYRAIAANQDAWSALDHQMDHYFSDAIDLFPYIDSLSGKDHSHEEPSMRSKDKGRSFVALVDKIIGIAKPDRFFEIQTARIERRFPGGRANDIGDGDLRDLISVLRMVFKYNFLRLIVGRRIWQLIGSVIAIFLLTLVGVGIVEISPTHASVLSVAMVIAVAWWFSLMTERYEGALTESCSNLRTGAQVRQQELYALIPLIFHQIDRDKFELKRLNKLDKWPEETGKWSKLIFWIEGRVEHNELFMQVEMWRLRRTNWQLRIIAYLVSIVIYAAAAVLAMNSEEVFLVLQKVALPFLTTTNSGEQDEWGLIHALQLFVVSVFAVMSVVWRLPNFDLIESTLKTKDMKGLQHVRLYAQVAEFMFNEKATQLHEEEKIAGKKI